MATCIPHLSGADNGHGAGNHCSLLPTGHLHNSEAFNYGVETWEAYKRGGLSKDLVEEQKKVQEADLLIFQVIILNNPVEMFTLSLANGTGKATDQHYNYPGRYYSKSSN